MFTIPPPGIDSNRPQVNNTTPSISITGTIQPHQMPLTVAAWNAIYQADATSHLTTTTADLTCATGVTQTNQMPLHAVAWNTPSQPVSNHIASIGTMQSHNTILEPPVTNAAIDHGKSPTDLKSLETIATPKNNSTNAEVDHTSTSQQNP